MLYKYLTIVKSNCNHFVAFVVEVKKSAHFKIATGLPKHIVLLELRCDNNILTSLRAHDDCLRT